jgi:large conductance mechanosensitive channel
MSFFQEFKTFAMRGNVVDLAIGVIIGAAFGKIVSSFVNDIIMPPLGVLLGGKDFNSLSIKIHEATADTPEVLIKYGTFINTIIDFAIIAFVIFAVIKGMNKLLPPKPQETTTIDCPECLMPIPVKAKKCGHCQTKFQHELIE